MDKDSLLVRVKKTIQADRLLAPGERVVVAVSGGADSLCLLHLLHTLAPELGLTLVVACLDHRFRRESAGETALVRRLALRLRLPLFTAAYDVAGYARRQRLGAQEAARIVRYRFLRQAAQRFCAQKVAVGHHRDDQVETVLLNILRGTGLDGLAAMPAIRSMNGKDGVKLVRPLLGVSRREIDEYCGRHGIAPVEDPSNSKMNYRRNRIRLELLPHLEHVYNPRIRDALVRLSRVLARDKAFLEALAAREFQRLLLDRAQGRLILDARALAVLHPAMQYRVLRLAVRRLGGGVPPGEEHLRALCDLAAAGRGGSIDLPGASAAASGGQLLLRRKRLPSGFSFTPRPLAIPGRTPLPGTNMVIESTLSPIDRLRWPPDSRREAYLDYHKIKETPVVRPRWPGARFQPLGMQGHKKIKDYMIEQKIPRWSRANYPLVAAGDQVIWVVGKQIAEQFKVGEQTTDVLVLRLIEL